MSPVDGKIHRYFVDGNVLIREGDAVKSYLVEIKPYAQTQPPKESKRKKKTTILYEKITYAVNQAKWDAARQYATKKKMEFLNRTKKINILNMAYSLIVEAPDPKDLEYVLEEKNLKGEKSLYIQGPYMMAGEENRNKRVYSEKEMYSEVARYSDEFISTKRALGELNHPTTAEVDLG